MLTITLTNSNYKINELIKVWQWYFCQK